MFGVWSFTVQNQRHAGAKGGLLSRQPAGLALAAYSIDQIVAAKPCGEADKACREILGGWPVLYWPAGL